MSDSTVLLGSLPDAKGHTVKRPNGFSDEEWDVFTEIMEAITSVEPSAFTQAASDAKHFDITGMSPHGTFCADCEKFFFEAEPPLTPKGGDGE